MSHKQHSLLGVRRYSESVWRGGLYMVLSLLFVTAPLAQSYSYAGGFLGVGLLPAEENDLLLRSTGASSGAIATAILPGSAAETAGVRPGDVITSINGAQINTSTDFLTRVARIEPGALVLVGALREGKPVRFLAFAQRRPEEARFQEAAASGPPMPVGTARCPVESVSGDWGGVEVTDRLQGIDVAFAFHADGTYSYFAGQGNAPWITQSGVFQISDTGDQRYPCRISLVPDSATVQIASPAHLFIVQSRDLMDDKPRTFMYKFFPTATHLMLAGTWTDWRDDIGTIGLHRR